MVISIDKLLLIVPAYNEEESLSATVQMLQSQPHDFVIINDGSTDNTAKIANSLGVPLISLPFNQGLAGAFLTGMQYACENGYQYAMQFDADGQHLPQFVDQMLIQMKQKGMDIVIGSRFLENKMPFSLRTFGSILIQCMLKITTGRSLTDPTSGMRMYNRTMIELYANRPDLTPEPDTIAYLMRNGISVTECQVTMQERIAGTSYLGSWSAAKYMCRMAFSILMIQFVRSKITREEMKV